MAYSAAEFELFQAKFKKWQERFGLNGWNVYFKYEPLGTDYAKIYYDLTQMTAVVSLNSDPLEEDKADNDIVKHAKHEAIHLLLGRLKANGSTRYISENEMTESCEELVHKLEGLID
ncbi:hypothetical protein ACFLXA_02690 [Chloroflexota bacterium]